MTSLGRFIVRPHLTAREREVAALIGASRTTKQIASYLGGVSEQRVRKITESIAMKIEADMSCDLRVTIALWWNGVAIRNSA